MSDSSDTQTPYAKRWARYRRLVRLGQVLMGIGLVMAVVHMAMHLAGNPSGWTDLTVGYPTAAVIAFAGIVLAGRAAPKVDE